MTELNKIRVLISVLLMTFAAHGLDVLFLCADGDLKQKSEIRTEITNGEKTYCGTLDQFTYQPEPDTSKVIVYIIDRSRFVEIIRNAVRETRLRIARELREWHRELVFLGIENFDGDEYNLISAFIVDIIQRDPGQKKFTIETIGENHFDHCYGWHVRNFSKYQENAQICGGTLGAHLRSIRHGALRPVGSNGKEIKLYGYHPHVAEVSWPVNIVNETYSLKVSVNIPKYNFRIRHTSKKICLLILGGKEYSALISHIKKRSAVTEMVERIKNEMSKNNEGLDILGVFNFHWTEIDIVTQIILKHSVGGEGYDYNVFTYGYGMFNTVYRNVNATDGRNILPQPQSNVSELIKVFMGEEVKERFIKMCYISYGWKNLEIPIKLDNGQYAPAGRFKTYTFPWVNQRIAFIVYNSTERNDPFDLRMVYRSMEELQRSGIYVAVIEAMNFGPDDMHIIAQWIDCHRGKVINSEQVTVLGAGIFDTIFQSKSTTYETLPNTNKDQLKNIRNAFATKGNGKRVFAAKIVKYTSSDPKIEVWTYPMNTVNGFYEPDLIPDKNMFSTTGAKYIFFIITSANRFHQISAMKTAASVTSAFRQEMRRHFSYATWNVFLVGLDNFDERDYHLFAELVKMQTNYERSMEGFICTFNYGIGPPIYRYKDNEPFPVLCSSKAESHVISFFESCLPDGTPSN